MSKNECESEVTTCPICNSQMEEETLGFGGGGRSFIYGKRCTNPVCGQVLREEPCGDPRPKFVEGTRRYICGNCGHPIHAAGVRWEVDWQHKEVVEHVSEKASR